VKLRSLLVLAAGIGIGYRLAKKMNEDDPDVVRGPQRRSASPQNPALMLVSGQAEKLAAQASVKSLEAIRRARGAIRERLGERETDDAAWN
jgi:hypothetical protein